MIDELFESDRLKETLALFSTLFARNSPLGLCKQGQVLEAVKLLEGLESTSCPPNEAMFDIIIQGYLIVGDLIMALQYKGNMISKGFSLHASTTEKLIMCAANDLS